MRTLRKRAIAVALAAAFAAPVLAQQGDEPLLLDLCINGRCIGVAAVIERGAEVLIDREAMSAAGVEVAGLPGERVGEREFIALRALGEGSTHAIDRNGLRLDLSLRPELLPGQRSDLRQRPQSEVGTQPWSAFVNYAATLGQREERGLFVDGALGRGHAALRGNAQWDRNEGWRRGLTRIEIDQPGHLRRWTIGDQYAVASDPLGGGLLLGGIGVERAFDQDPYLVTFPQPFYTGVMETPGTVEIYSNGVLIGRRDIGAGPFTLDNLGVQPGRSDVQVVVRDPFGNRTELATATYYGASSRMLAPGLVEYALRIGVPRESGGLGGGYSDRAALQGWYRRGFADTFTFGGRVEADEDLHNIGLDGVVRLPVGEVTLAMSISSAEGAGHGSAAAATYNYSSRYWSLGLGSRRADASYRNLGDPFASLVGPIRADDYASLGISPRNAISVQINAGRQRREGSGTARTLGLSSAWRLWSRAQLLFSVQRRDDDFGRDTTALLSLNVALNRDSFGLSLRGREDADGERTSGYGFDARRSRPPGTGWGYDVSYNGGDASDAGFAQVEYQGTKGRYALQAEHIDGQDSARVIASGALVALGGRVFATPPVESGFALVRVPGLAGLPILRENLEVGRTDAQGDLLVRDLLPFYANRIALDEAAVPPGYALRTPKRQVQVPRNTGSLVTLDAAPVRAVTGRLVRHGTEGDVAAGNRAWVSRDGERVAEPLGSLGRFYFEDLPAGRHEVEAEGSDGSIRCAFDVPAAASPGIVDLGRIACRNDTAEEAP